MPISRPHPAGLRRSYLPAPPPPPETLEVSITGGGVKYITGAGTVLFDFTISATGGDGGPYTFNVGYGDQVGMSVNFQFPLTVVNGGTASSFANGSAHDSSGVSGSSNSQFYSLVSNPV